MSSKKGVVEWLVLLLPAMVVGVGLIVSYVSLQKDVEGACLKFTEDIARIEHLGTTVSTKNSLDIVSLQVKFETIDQRLKRIEDGQAQMLTILSQRVSKPQLP